MVDFKCFFIDVYLEGVRCIDQDFIIYFFKGRVFF